MCPFSEYFSFTVYSNLKTHVLFMEQKPNDKVESEAELLKSIDLIGNQVAYLWSIFFNFLRFVFVIILSLLENVAC